MAMWCINKQNHAQISLTNNLVLYELNFAQIMQQGLLKDLLKNNLSHLNSFTDFEQMLAVRIALKFTKTIVKSSISIARLDIRLPSLNLYENSITTLEY